MYRPPFEELENTKKEELFKTIKRTKTRLIKLRDIMEHPSYKSKPKKCPDELTAHKCERDFFNMAIARYVTLGGKYVYGEKELADTEFNDRIEDIAKVTFTFGACLDIKSKIVVELTGETLVFKDGDSNEIIDMPFEYDKPSFLAELHGLHLGEWEEHYTPNRFGIYVLDGTQWELKIEYKNGTQREFGGCNAYPYNFEDLLSLLHV